jgi:AcrR family transcriptional regulator
VAKTAGLSVGIVNFHFDTKEGLLVETLKSLAEEYRGNWHEALRNAGPRPADTSPSHCPRSRCPARGFVAGPHDHGKALYQAGSGCYGVHCSQRNFPAPFHRFRSSETMTFALPDFAAGLSEDPQLG